MPKKLPNEKRKRYIREKFDKIDPSTLNVTDLSYYNKVKAGKARAKKAIRIEGKYLSGAIIDIMAKVAHSKGKSMQTYIDENKTAILRLINSGYTSVSKNIDKAIDIVAEQKKKTVNVNTGNGIVTIPKIEVIEALSSFQQHVKSTTNVVMLATVVKTYKNNRIEITIPEGYDMYEGEELIDFLDDFEDIHYVQS